MLRKAPWVAIALLIISGGLALVTLRTQLRPEQDLPSVGFAGPFQPVHGAGYAVTVSVSVPTDVFGCENPATVRVVVAGPTEFWKTYKDRIQKSSPFAFSVITPDATPVRLRAGRFEESVPPASQPLEQSLESPGHVPTKGVSEVDSGTRGNGEDRPIGHYAVGRVQNWADTHTPLVAEFEADWVFPRSFGSCYVELPALTGAAGVIAAGDARGAIKGPDARAVFNIGNEPASAGSVTLLTPGSIGPDSAPPPDDPRTLTWSCGGGDDLFSVSRNEYSVDAYRRAAELSSGCSAYAVVTTPAGDFLRSALLVLMGALLSLGIQVLYQNYLGRGAGTSPTVATPERDKKRPPRKKPATRSRKKG